MNKKTIITIGGLLLCVLFFTAPLVQCSQQSSLSATGLEIAVGTGELMSEADKSYPIVFVLLIMPIILVIAAFADKSFATLRMVSIAGLVAQIIFMIAAYAMLNSDDYDGAFVLTSLNWLIAAIYIGLIGFAQYCNTNASAEVHNKRRSFSHKRCRQCDTVYSGSEHTCPKCNSSLYEEVNASAGNENNINSLPTATPISGDTWVCKKCGEKNPRNSDSCKGCGTYR